MKAYRRNKGIFSPIGVTFFGGGARGGKRDSNDPQTFFLLTHIFLGY